MLNVDSISTHDAPPITNAASVSTSHGLNAETPAVIAKPSVPSRTSFSLSIFCRAAALTSAPQTAPTPKKPNSSP